MQCARCRRLMTQVGAFWVCPDHGRAPSRPLVEQESGSERLLAARLFLSYGRRDAKDLADRLVTDLGRHGYEVWLDTRQIRAGSQWEQEIKDGLRSTQILVALLSPYSVRVASNACDPDDSDSVCLDEISFARFARPPKPIVPIMAAPCEPPLCIFRLDYVDMCAWSASPAHYESGFSRLLTAIEAALHGQVSYRRWVSALKPWDFAAFLHEKRRGFCGRKWLFEEIERWRALREERVLLITGDPGIGKSAIVAQLVHLNPSGQVLAYHCCQADTPATVAPGLFVRSLAAMIASQLKQYATCLSEPAMEEALSESSCASDPASSFERGILTPLESFLAPEQGVRYILVDALDESLAVAGGTSRTTIVDVLASRVERLPAWLRIVATTRKDRKVLDHLRGLRAFEIDSQKPDNTRDVETYVRQRIQVAVSNGHIAEGAAKSEQICRVLCEKSGGNFLYVQQVLQGIERGVYGFDRLDELPPGLHSIYLRFLARDFPDDTAFARARSVLGVVLAAREPLTLEELARITGIDAEEELPKTVRSLAPYMPEREGRYVIYHKSLADWLTDLAQRGTPYYVSLKRGHEQLAGAFLRECKDDPVKASDLAVKHALFHAAMAGQRSEVQTLLKNRVYLSRRLGVSGLSSLIEDLHAVLHEMPDMEPLCLRLIRALTHRRLLLEQIPSAVGQELSNQRCIEEDNSGLGSTRLETGLYLHLERGPTDLEQVVLPRVIVDVQVAPDGHHMVTSGGMFHGLWVWRFPQIEPEAFLLGHQAGVAGARFLPDSRTLVSGSWDGHVKIWNICTADALADFHEHNGFVQTVAVSEDGCLGISGGWDGRVVLYDLTNRAVLGELCNQGGQVSSLRISPDSSRLVITSGEGHMAMWDVRCRTLLRSWKVSGGWLRSADVDWSLGLILACTLGGDLDLFALDSPAALAERSVDGAPFEWVVVQPSLKLAFTGDGTGRLTCWRYPELVVHNCVQAHEGRLAAGTVFRDTLVTAGGDQRLQAWDVRSMRPLWTYEAKSYHLVSADITDTGKAWWGIDDGGRVISQEGYGSPKQIAVSAEAGPAYVVRWVRDQVFLLGTTTGQVALYESSRLKWLQRPHRFAVCQFAISPARTEVVSVDIQGYIYITDITSGHPIGTRRGLNGKAIVDWAPDGNGVYWIDGAGNMWFWGRRFNRGEAPVASGLCDAHHLLVVGDSGLAIVVCGRQLVIVELASGKVNPVKFRLNFGVTRLSATRKRGEVLVLGRDGGIIWFSAPRESVLGATQIVAIPIAAVPIDGNRLIVLDAAGREYGFRVEG